MAAKYKIEDFSSSEEDEDDRVSEVELPETDADESIIIMPKKIKGVRKILDSDDEEAQRDFDRITLSPKTRRSIGIRASTRFKSSSESDDLLSEDEESENKESEDEEFHTGDNTPTDTSTNIQESFKVAADKSGKLNNSALNGSSYPGNASSRKLETANSEALLTDDESDDEETASKSEELEGAVGGKSPTIHDDSHSISGADSFADGIVDKLSSTRYSKVYEVDDALEKVQKGLKNLEISSEDIVIIDSDDSTTDEKKVHVSESFYNQEKEKLENLLEYQQKMKDLYNKLGTSLPDRGKQILIKQKETQAEIDDLVKYISTLTIDGTKDSPKVSIRERLSEEVAASLESVQYLTEPEEKSEEFKEKGKKEPNQRKTEAPKAIQIAHIKEIHKSLDTCPPEDMLMEEPKGLKVSLMDHQRYALTFMTWREKKVPQGGILGDDMGT
uniref:Uncharacterized protein n=1 Tax=Phlebotomus papatasi TaxID=29031 RepID=A0A1B0DCS8_PHLPP